MDMQGQQHIRADRETVWKALNNPEILKVCIPGCQELTKTSDTEMTAVAVIKVGPVSARFKGAVSLSELDPPNGYKINGEGQGGVAGFAKGAAIVRLEQIEDGTKLYYEVEAQIGGKLSQLGGRLIDSTARKMAASFFEKFGQEIAARQQPADSPRSDIDAVLGDKIRPARTAPGESRGELGTEFHPDLGQSPVQERQGAAATSIPAFLKYVGAAALGGAMMIVWVQYGFTLFGSGVTENQVLDAQTHVSPSFTNTVQLIMAAAIGYLFGARR